MAEQHRPHVPRSLFHSSSGTSRLEEVEAPPQPSTVSPRSPRGMKMGLDVHGGISLVQPKSRLPAADASIISAYSQAYDRGATNPSMAVAGLSGRLRGERPDSSPLNVSGAHPVSTGLQSPKRAYRQRRKDPSCDACRERKVKCDATETSSCSECTSRNVRCQFTKETNRRMSSIKQVQDLEKQLALANDQLNQFQSDFPSLERSNNSPSLPSEFRPRKRQRLSEQDFSRVRKAFKDHGRGILSSQIARSPSRPQSWDPTSYPDLPPRVIADRLLRRYFDSFHTNLPIIHWDGFNQKYEIAYSSGSLRQLPRDWGALLFAIFACSALNDPEDNGQAYLDASRIMVGFWVDFDTIDYVRCAFLVSIYYNETSFRSAGWSLLGCAIRIAQAIGLHKDTAVSSSAESDARRYLWWALYISDRLLSLDIGRPAMIDDDDCDVEPPESLKDGSTEPNAAFSSTLKAVRPISQVLKALRTCPISPYSLQMLDGKISNLMATFPPHHQVQADDYIDHSAVAAVIYLQNARIILHRQNLSPQCASDVRSTAIDNCVLIAKDTAKLLSRSMRDTPGLPMSSHPQAQKWETKFASTASTLLCIHIWRCALFLCLGGEFKAALICCKANAAIFDARVINLACGRYLEFFLQTLNAKLQRECSDDLKQDEEMIAYVSGDMQGSVQTAWIWENSVPLLADDEASSPNPLHFLEKEGEVWNGWDRVIAQVKTLLDDQLHAKQQQQSQSHLQAEQEIRLKLTSPDDAVANPQIGPGGSSRITIASIIGDAPDSSIV